MKLCKFYFKRIGVGVDHSFLSVKIIHMQKKLQFPRVNLFAIRKFLLVLIVTGGIFSFGYILGHKGYKASAIDFPDVTIIRELPENQKTLEFSLFWRVWDTLESKYFDKKKLIPYEMVYGAIKGMVASIGDPYTVFLPPEENKVVQEDLQGSFEGVGIQIGFKGTQLAVISPLPGSPAKVAGVKAGDFIIGIKDEEKGIDRGTVGITLPEAVQAIRGPKGSTITLILLREDGEEPIVVDIVRANIDVPSVTYSFVGENESIIHVRILKFSGETVSEWEKVVIEILKKPEIEGIILDVRNNPGGFLEKSVDLASEFLDNGSLVVTEERSDGTKHEFNVQKLGRLKNQKVVVLINKGSASASEILAGALRDIRGIKLVGETTFGKGTIQESLEVDGGAGLHITIARWLTPSGFWVDEGGLKPDVEVSDDPETQEDEQLQKVIELLSS